MFKLKNGAILVLLTYAAAAQAALPYVPLWYSATMALQAGAEQPEKPKIVDQQAHADEPIQSEPYDLEVPFNYGMAYKTFLAFWTAQLIRGMVMRHMQPQSFMGHIGANSLAMAGNGWLQLCAFQETLPPVSSQATWVTHLAVRGAVQGLIHSAIIAGLSRIMPQSIIWFLRQSFLPFSVL